MVKLGMTTFKRYALSSLTTFLTTFFLFIGTNLGSLDFAHLTGASVAGFLMIAVRAAVKSVVEYFAGNHADPLSVEA